LPDEQDVALLQLGLVGLALRVDALVVVVDRDGDDLLRHLLADDVVVEDAADLLRLRHTAVPLLPLFLLDFLCEDVVAQRDALVADVDGRSSDELFDLLLTLATKGAAQVAVASVAFRGAHRVAFPQVGFGVGRWRTSSTRP
jgi:hypothetical protein